MPRRRQPHGSGSLFWRADRQRFILEIDVPDRGGQPRRKTLSFRTRGEALRKQRELLAQRDSGLPGVDERQTVGAYLAEYVTVSLADRAPRTRINAEGMVRVHLTPQLGTIKLAQLQPGQIAECYRVLLGKGLAPSTVRNAHGLLRAALNQAVAWDLLLRNPVLRVRPPSVAVQERAILTASQVARVLVAVRGHRLEALAWLAATTGLRQGELLGLQWQDVDLERGELHVRRQRRQDGGELAPLKTARSLRILPIEPHARAALERLRDRGAPSALLFPSRAGRPLAASWLLNRWWYPLLDRAGVPRVRFHDARHGAGSYLLDLGMSLAQVSRILGHSSVAITGRLYVHAVTTTDHEIMGRLGDLFAAENPEDAGRNAVSPDEAPENPAG